MSLILRWCRPCKDVSFKSCKSPSSWSAQPRGWWGSTWRPGTPRRALYSNRSPSDSLTTPHVFIQKSMCKQIIQEICLNIAPYIHGLICVTNCGMHCNSWTIKTCSSVEDKTGLAHGSRLENFITSISTYIRTRGMEDGLRSSRDTVGKGLGLGFGWGGEMVLVMGGGADMVRGGMLIRRRSWTWQGGSSCW